MVTCSAPLNPVIENLRDELEASEFVREMKDMDIRDLEAQVKWNEHWGDAMYDRAWKAEAAIEDFERKMQVVKAELMRSREQTLLARHETSEAKRELEEYVTTLMSHSGVGSLVNELHELKQNYKNLQRAIYPEDRSPLPKDSDSEDSEDSGYSDDLACDSPVSPIELAPPIKRAASVPVKMANRYSFADMYRTRRFLELEGTLWGGIPEPKGKPSAYNPPTPTRVPSSSES